MMQKNVLVEHLLQLGESLPEIYDQATIIISDSPSYFEGLTRQKVKHIDSPIKIPTIKQTMISSKNYNFIESTDWFLKPNFNHQKSNYPLNAYYLMQSIKNCKIVLVFDANATDETALITLKTKLIKLLNLLELVPGQKYDNFINSICFVIAPYEPIKNKDMITVFKNRFHQLYKGTINHQRQDIIKQILLVVFEKNRYAICADCQNMEAHQKVALTNILNDMPGYSFQNNLNIALTKDQNYILESNRIKQCTGFMINKILDPIFKNFLKILSSTHKKAEIRQLLNVDSYQMTLKLTHNKHKQVQQKDEPQFAKICKICSNFLELMIEIVSEDNIQNKKELPFTKKISIILENNTNNIDPQTIAILKSYDVVRSKIKQIRLVNIQLIEYFQQNIDKILTPTLKALEKAFTQIDYKKSLRHIDIIIRNLDQLIQQIQNQTKNFVSKYRLQNLWRFKAIIKLKRSQHQKVHSNKQKLSNLLDAYQFSRKCQTFNRQDFNYIYERMGNLVKLNQRTGLAVKLFKKGQCYLYYFLK